MFVDRVLIRQKALLAASSVVLALSMPGCVPTHPKPSNAGDSGPADTSSTSDTSAGDTSATDTSGGDTSGGDTSRGDTSGGDTSSGDTSDARPDCDSDTAASIVECCADLYAWCEEHYGAGTAEASDCYYGSDTSGSSACSPWGPPAPPRLRAAIA